MVSTIVCALAVHITYTFHKLHILTSMNLIGRRSLNMRCIHFGTFTFAFHLLIKGEKEMKMCQLARASAGAERGGIQLYFN